MKRIVLLWCGAVIILALLFFSAGDEGLFEASEALEVFAGDTVDSWDYIQPSGSPVSDKNTEYISEDFIHYLEGIVADENEESVFMEALPVGEIPAVDFERFIPDVFENSRISAGDENAGFISYDENIYLVTDYINYDTKARTGLKVYAFREDEPVEEALIYRYPASHEGQERIKTDSDCEKIASVIYDSSHDWYMDLVYSYSGMALVGKGEKINTAEGDIFNFTADLDNDGLDEKYRKERRYPSLKSQLAQLKLEIQVSNLDEGSISKLEQINFYENCKLPQLLWVERDSAGMNIVCVLSSQNPFDTNQEDFQHDKYYIDGYRIQGETCERVLLYSFVPQYEVVTKIYKYDNDEGQNP